MNDNDKIAALKAREAQRNNAFIANDVAALGEILADDLTYVHASGKLDGKATLLASIGRDYRYLSSERGELNVRMLGDTAVMTGPAKIVLKNNTKPDPITLDCNLTQVWTLQGGTWRMVAYHGSRVPAP
jgi:ketosteroid isomerase-like protein